MVAPHVYQHPQNNIPPHALSRVTSMLVWRFGALAGALHPRQ